MKKEKVDEAVSRSCTVCTARHAGRVKFIMLLIEELTKIIPCTVSILEQRDEAHHLIKLSHEYSIDEVLLMLENVTKSKPDLCFLMDLARLEFTRYTLENADTSRAECTSFMINPTLNMVPVSWQGVLEYMQTGICEDFNALNEPDFVLIYKSTVNQKVKIKKAGNNDLLALKLIGEDVDLSEFAGLHNMALRDLEDIIDAAADNGIIIKPESKIIRDPAFFPRLDNIDPSFYVSQFFTLQWHITQACDLHCRHCYDRTDRSPLDVHTGMMIVDQMRQFCDEMNVRGQISFTGGNPLLYPDFIELYRAADERGLYCAILGNPATRQKIEELLNVTMPEFYQVSLEGLEEHNDYIRGRGHFKRTMDFLSLLREYGIYSMVMLTLTKDNIDQVIPLAEMLKGKVDRFTFNRLALFGEGANLAQPDNKTYEEFLHRYLAVSENNPHMGIKDSLFNIIKSNEKCELFGGCAGFGCGAAFNFVSLLPDGEVHACRKMPSLIGNIYETGLNDIYASDRALQYRTGASECKDCSIRPVCGGCLAVAMSNGLDIFTQKDPMCFKEKL